MIVSPYATHHDPRYWMNPEIFDPDRFEPASFDDRARLADYPFGMGQRRCIGEPLSLVIASLALATVMSRYDLSPLGGPVRARYAMTYQPRDGVQLLLRRRRERR